MLKSVPDNPHNFSLADTRKIVNDLFTPNPVIYWADFLFCDVVWTVCYAAVRYSPRVVPEISWQRLFAQGVCFLVSCLLYYRVALFIHEIVHLRRGTFTVFRFVWNLLVGIPFLIPSFVYYTHLDHHRRTHFGTAGDGEYIAFGGKAPRQMVFHLLLTFLIPILVIFRFMILSPLTWCIPPLRRWVHQHASSMIIDPNFVRPLPTRRVLRTIRLQEFMCFLWCWGIALIPPIFLDRWAVNFIIHAYCTAVFIIMLNAIRTLGTHRWRNTTREEMTFVDQLLDSVNVPKRWFIGELWGPVGLRFHALHHLFPSMPYHSMPAAHRRLLEQLPADSPYRRVNENTLTASLVDLWRRSAAAAQQAKSTPVRPQPHS